MAVVGEAAVKPVADGDSDAVATVRRGPENARSAAACGLLLLLLLLPCCSRSSKALTARRERCEEENVRRRSLDPRDAADPDAHRGLRFSSGSARKCIRQNCLPTVGTPVSS